MCLEGCDLELIAVESLRCGYSVEVLKKVLDATKGYTTEQLDKIIAHRKYIQSLPEPMAGMSRG